MVDTIAILERLVGFDTTSHRSNLNLVDWAISYLEQLGARLRVSHDDSGSKANILASFGPNCAGGIVLSGHTDVVPAEGQAWSSDPFRLVERGARLYGRGAADMKGFVAACLSAASGFASANLRRPIHLALSYDEEIGCLGVPRLIADLLAHERMPALAIIGEPTGMCLGDRHRGFLGFRTRFTGCAAHSSDPSAGASAIYPASAFVTFLQALGDRDGSGADRTTFNVGRIDGGSAINIVPYVCEVLWEFRPAPEADTSVLRTTVETYLARATPTGILQETEILTQVPPLSPAPGNLAVQVARELGGADPTFAMPFGTEAGFFQAAGIPSVVCGPGFIAQAHQPDEWISREQLGLADVFLARLASWAAAEPLTQSGSDRSRSFFGN
jgi:acetylornithine deacetylase